MALVYLSLNSPNCQPFFRHSDIFDTELRCSLHRLNYEIFKAQAQAMFNGIFARVKN